MWLKTGIVSPLLMVAVVGCTPHSAAIASSSAEGSAAPATADSAATQAEAIKDPTLNNMTAWIVTIPAKWHFQGTLYQGGTCRPVPNPVYRAMTPDGLGYVENMPAISWRYGTGPAAQPNPNSDCLPVKGAMTGQEFLQRLAEILHVHYDGPAPVPDALNAEAQANDQKIREKMAPGYAANHMEQPKSSVELARAYVSYKNGTFAMKGRIDVNVGCSTSTVAAPMVLGPWGGPGHPPRLVKSEASTVNDCISSIQYMTAPVNKFDALARQWDAPGIGAHGQDAHAQAWIQRGNEQTQQAMGQIARWTEQTLQARAQQFQHDQAVRQQIHDQFIDSMQQNFQQHQAVMTSNMDARATVASDWVDYALNQRTVADPTTGQLTKVSNQAVTAWSDNAGNVFSSKDPTWNPNQVLPGTWTQQTSVHGDGTPQ